MTLPTVDEQQRNQASIERLGTIAGWKLLAGRLYRQVQMLQAQVGDKVFASSNCPICFRDYPHAADVHDDECHRFRALEPVEVSGIGYVTGRQVLWNPEDPVKPPIHEPATIPPASSSGQAPIPSEAAVDGALNAWFEEIDGGEGDRALERTMRRALTAAYAIDHPAGEVTKGWQIVPTHLTIAMGRAAWEAQDHNGASAVSGIADGRTYALDTLWAALLSSAPQPPKSNSGGK